MDNQIDRSLFSLDSLIKFRHWMHINPELAYKEFNTIAKIKEYLTVDIKVDPSSIKPCTATGLIVTLSGTGPSKGKNTYKVILS
jgi:metal-dependent amidase/aminoacylase/carboxypeptidase family protein